ncbi:MAG: ThiF family adenylyltransferase [Terracidiphilus sp.]|jgi:molybdopterin/thiamine biosynthesis adenylyltransferase
MQMKTQSVVVAGAGGNTGSHLLPHLARMANVAQIALIDPDLYEESNVAVQNIDRQDIGKPKVEAQAEKLRKINPRLGVTALQERIEDVPLGLMRCDLLVSCLDSRASRQFVNQIATRLNIQWIDCGVLGSQNLARVNTYTPGLDAPCLECSWSPDDYAQIEQEYLCGAGSGAAFPTMASSALGALAASLMALEIAKLLFGELTGSAATRQVLIDAQNHIMRTTTSRRNPDCRFDHQAWDIQAWRRQPESTTVETALKELGSLQIEGHRFVHALICPGCQRQEQSLRLNRPLVRCPACGKRMVSAGFGSLESLNMESARGYYDLTLAQIGLREGDIISSGSNEHWQMEAA